MRAGGGLEAPRWEIEGADWPNRAFSRFLRSAGIRWHVQELGDGPDLLLVHGAGASTHSFRDLAPALAARFRVLVIDLPGHGFTELPAMSRLGLEAMASATAHVVRDLGRSPCVVVGHSAGAAILCRMVLDAHIRPQLIVGLNPALVPFEGWAGVIYSPIAKLVVRHRVAPRLLSWRARDRRIIQRTIEGTGSRIDARGLELYQRLVRCPGHVAGTVGMMARWDLNPLARELPTLDVPLLLVLGDEDRAVPMTNAWRVQSWVPSVKVHVMGGAGHLAHEERPEETARLVFAEAESRGVLAPHGVDGLSAPATDAPRS